MKSEHSPYIVAIIPARYSSTRFPGKPLALVGGVPMIERVYRRVVGAKVVDRVIVATDDVRIQDAVLGFGGEVLMTQVECVNGTSRCFAAIQQLEPKPDAIINVQGDEPFVHPDQLRELVSLISEPDAAIATLAIKMDATDPGRENPNKVKVVCDNFHKAMYFSRSAIPHNEGVWYQHLGLYGFTREALEAIEKLMPSRLEERENLEQLRWLCNGISIAVGRSNHRTPSVDTPEDLKKIEELLGSGWSVD